VLSSPGADACAGWGVCASSGRRTFRRAQMDRGGTGHRGADRARRPGGPPAEVRKAAHVGGTAVSGRPAVRGLWDASPGEAVGGRRGEGLGGQREGGCPDRQPTGRGGHGSTDVPRQEAGCHRRTPHGRAFACGSRSSRHHDSERLADRCHIDRHSAGRNPAPGCIRTVVIPPTTAPSVRGRAHGANVFPKRLERSTPRAEPRQRPRPRVALGQEPLAAAGHGGMAWKN
jgi:hypothetical protein